MLFSPSSSLTHFLNTSYPPPNRLSPFSHRPSHSPLTHPPLNPLTPPPPLTPSHSPHPLSLPSPPLTPLTPLTPSHSPLLSPPPSHLLSPPPLISSHPPLSSPLTPPSHLPAGRVYDQAWDASKALGCLCDAGYRGPSCEWAECPSGPDPMDGYGNNTHLHTCYTHNAHTHTHTHTRYTHATNNEQHTHNTPSHMHIFSRVLTHPLISEHTFTHTCTLVPPLTLPLYIPPCDAPTPGNESGRDCSGRGVCDYNVGMCDCFMGWFGDKCQHKVIMF